MKNKYIRFLTSDRKLQLEALFLIAGFFILGMESCFFSKQAKDLRRLTAEKKLVQQIPQFEKVTHSGRRSVKLAQVTTSGIKNYQLSGISSSDGNFYALINDEVHKVGDTIGEYTITKIDPEAVTLQSNNTNNSIYLYLYADVPVVR